MNKRSINKRIRRLKWELKHVPSYNFMKRLKINKEIDQLKTVLKERI